MKNRVLQYFLIIAILSAIAGGWFYYKGKAAETLRTGTIAVPSGNTKTINASQVNKLTDGLTHHYTFDGADMSGDTVYDKVSAGTINGTLTNCNTPPSPKPYRSIGKIGQGITIPGNDVSNWNACVNLSSAIVTGTTFSVSLWLKPNFDEEGFLFGAGANSRISLASSGGRINYRFSSADHLNSTMNLISIGNWNHVVVSVDNGTATFHINGTADGTASGVVSMNASRIGSSGGDNGFDGSIDEFRFYNKALSQSEITELYQQGQTKINASQTGKLTDGLVGHWTMDGNDTSWSGNTATVTNRGSIGSGANGTSSGMFQSTSPTIGKIGQGMYFDGSNDYINTGDDSGLNLPATTGSVSVSAWVKPIGGTANAQAISRKWGAGNHGWRLIFDDAGGDCAADFVAFQNGSGVCSNNAIPLNAWTHLVGVSNTAESSSKIYINGVLDSSDISLGTISSSGQGHTIGGASTAYYFKGSIDEVRVYSRALSASEVTELYNQGR